MALLLLPMAITDICYRRIPKNLNHLLLIFIWLHEPILVPLIWLSYLAIFRFSKGAIGYGDVRLAPCTLLPSSHGENPWIEPHLYAWVLGGVVALFSLKSKENLPFAPFIFAGALITESRLAITLR
jgi:prepilin signal peptidase PulO-like enzyme (type II secretory pathway)